MTCDGIILVCRLHPRCETYDSAIRPHDRPADGRRGALTCVAMHDPAKRRGLWFRVTDEGDGHLIEFFAGREGDNDYFSVRTGEVFDERDTADALGVLASARWGYELGHESDYYGDASARESQFAPHYGGWCGDTAERCVTRGGAGGQGPVHLAAMIDERLASCTGRRPERGELLRLDLESTPREDRCEACLNAVLKAAASLQKWATLCREDAAQCGVTA